MLRSVYQNMRRSSTTPVMEILDDDDSGDESSVINKPRDYLASLITEHQKLVTEISWSTLDVGECVKSSVINFFLTRILQPKADMADKGIVFHSADVYETIKRGDSVEEISERIIRHYNVKIVNSYVHVCNTPGHWITVIVNTDANEICCFDSLQPTLSSANNKILLKFSELYNHVYGEAIIWTLKSGLSGERLQNNGIDCGVWAMLFAECALDHCWNEAILKACDINSERTRIKGECTRLFSLNEYLESFTHEGRMYTEPNPESRRLMLDAVILSRWP